ncbi:EAL domain-containing protein [Kineosporiaceae bacterium SCSIO 59966]|nr:EAL domain-containing protein [Kineosporiaceae bacterium SCSIO 59966]
MTGLARPLPVAPRQVPGRLLGDVAELAARVLSAAPHSALEVAAEGVHRLTAADLVVVSTAEGGSQLFRVVVGDDGGPGPRPGEEVPTAHSVAGEALATRQVQVCHDAADDPRVSARYSELHAIRSSVVVPLLVNGRPHGLLGLVGRAPRLFGDDDVAVAQLVAGAVAARLQDAVRAAEQESLLGTVFDALDEGIVVRSAPDGIVLVANTTAERILGAEDDGLVGRPVRTGWQWFDEDGGELAVADLPTATTLRTGEPVRDRLVHVHRGDGGSAWLELTALPVHDDAGQMTSVVTRVADVTARIRVTEDLRRSQRRLAAATAVTGLAWWDYDVLNDRHVWSDAMFALVGLEPGEPPGIQGLLDRVHPEDRELLTPDDRQAGSRVFRVVHDDGTVRYLQSWSDVVHDQDGRVRHIHGTTLDVTEREQSLRAVADSEEMFRAAFDDAPTGMAIISLAPERAGTVLRANTALVEMLGVGPDGLVDRPITRWLHPDELPDAAADLARLGAGRQVAARDVLLTREDGRLLHAWARSAVMGASPGAEPCVLVHYLDVTDQRRAEASLRRMAMTDTLTGLANRTRFTQTLTAALGRLPSEPGDGTALAALMLDLDRFKLVNDALGHPVGDELLVAVAGRLRQAVPARGDVARLGGDEFVVLIEGTSTQAALDVADRIAVSLREPYDLPSGRRVVTSASVGVAIARTSGHTTSDLMREADLALYRAKDAGRDRVALCDDETRALAVARVDVENVLRAALDGDGLRVHLQPVVDLASRTVVGAEALVRVATSDGVLLPPAAFIGVAEETGLIVRVDQWVVEQVAAWLAGPGADLPHVAVNVSSRSLHEPGFADQVVGALARHGLPGHRLQVEITETVLLEATTEADQALGVLRDAGVAVGLDDFGTGYSALAYLQRLPLDFLKIDRSFVSRLGQRDVAAEATVRAIVEVAHAHRLQVTAEGVETRDQELSLRAAGCDFGQGWLFGRPTPTATFTP